MRFFISDVKNEEEALEIYEQIKKFAIKNTTFPITERKIYHIEYEHDGIEYSVSVGQMHPNNWEPIFAIFEANAFLVCTANRGVFIGEPILVGTTNISKIEEFEK